MSTLVDTANWTDIRLQSVDVGARTADRQSHNPALFFLGHQYCTPEERILAELLYRLDIPFTPDVPFSFPDPNRGGKRRSRFVPDFVFNRSAYVWDDGHGPAMIIHGIEAKRSCEGGFPRKGLEKVKLLYLERRIRIHLLSNSDILRYEREGSLPLVRFT